MKRMMTLAALAVLTFGATLAHAADDKLVAAAKAEGKVVVYSTVSYTHLDVYKRQPQ